MEAVPAVLGVISSIVTIIEGIQQVFEAARNAQGLPEAFRDVAGRLPIVRQTLRIAHNYYYAGGDSSTGVIDIVQACEQKAKTLDMLFQKVCPPGGASHLEMLTSNPAIERYYKAAKGLGKANKVEDLMKRMLEDVQVLAFDQGMKTATRDQQSKIHQAIEEMKVIPPSVPEEIYREATFAASNFGTGTQYNAQGDAHQYFAQANARQYNSGGGSQYFGPYNFNTNGERENTREACMAALFLTDPTDDREKLKDLKGSIVDGTCRWIESNGLYNSWLRSDSQLLWLSGGPGSKGKTMLSVFLAERLEKIAEQSDTRFLLQYFCDNKDEKRNTAVAVIRGLIYQLLKIRPALYKHIEPIFEVQKESLFSASSFQTLWRIFEAMLRDPTVGQTYCVLDGLDECEKDSLELLLKRFGKLFGLGSSEPAGFRLKLIITSRERPEIIQLLLSDFPRIRLDPDADIQVNQDIHFFIESKVEELSRYREYTQPLREHVTRVFHERAQGTFLWVGMVASMLRKYSRPEVVQALYLFPKGLDQIYARILLSIPNDQRELAAKLLRWVIMTVRPLTLSELGDAIGVSDQTSSAVNFRRDEVMRAQVTHCGDILTFKDDRVGLVHQSAKDYLLRDERDEKAELNFFRVNKDAINLEITHKCFDHLERHKFTDEEMNAFRDRRLSPEDSEIASQYPDPQACSPFLLYATLYWPRHAKFLPSSAGIFSPSSSFLHEKSQSLASWSETYDIISGYITTNKYLSDIPLHVAARFDILPLAERLLSEEILGSRSMARLKKSSLVNKRNEWGWTALHAAAERGHEAMVRLLLLNGARVDESGREKVITPLRTAVSYGHNGIVQILLDEGAKVNISVTHGMPLLCLAAQRGHDAVVKSLLDKGAKVDAREAGSEMTALHVSAMAGHATTAQILLDNRADIEAKDLHGQTALHLALIYGCDAVTRVLLDSGANVHNACHLQSTLHLLADGLHLSADGLHLFSDELHLSADREGDESIGKMLLDKGVDIEAQDGEGRTALHLASNGGRLNVVRLLLEHGADTGARDKAGRTAFDIANHALLKSEQETVKERYTAVISLLTSYTS